MIYINGHWETIDSLQDISRIVRECYDRELADEMDKLIEIQEKRIQDLEDQIDAWECNDYGDY